MTVKSGLGQGLSALIPEDFDSATLLEASERIEQVMLENSDRILSSHGQYLTRPDYRVSGQYSATRCCAASGGDGGCEWISDYCR